MKRFAIATIIAGLTLAPAFADGLTVGQCFSIYNGLIALERKVVTDEKGQQKVEPTGFKLSDIVWERSVNLAALERIVTAIERSRQQISVDIASKRECPAGVHNCAAAPIAPYTAEGVEFERRMSEILAKPCDTTPARIKFDTLHVGPGKDQNDIPASTISLLLPIIDKEK